MNPAYSFLKDELALIEIRKHKWIESEKQGAEIGFGTAALDWIKKYGAVWKRYRLDLIPQQPDFSERRHLRRFSNRFPLRIAFAENSFKCHTNDISLVGLSCTLPRSLPADAEANVTLLVEKNGRAKSRFQFKSRIARISEPKDKSGYNVFFPFTEEVRDYLRDNAEILTT